MVFICFSLVARDPQHSFMYLLGIQIPFLEEILLMFFAHFLTGLCVLLLLSFMRSLHMLNTDPLPVAWLAKVFFHVLVAPSFCGGSPSQCKNALVLAIFSKIVWQFAWPIHIAPLFIHFFYLQIPWVSKLSSKMEQRTEQQTKENRKSLLVHTKLTTRYFVSARGLAIPTAFLATFHIPSWP